jgi:hypothetical protein
MYILPLEDRVENVNEITRIQIVSLLLHGNQRLQIIIRFINFLLQSMLNPELMS